MNFFYCTCTSCTTGPCTTELQHHASFTLLLDSMLLCMTWMWPLVIFSSFMLYCSSLSQILHPRKLVHSSGITVRIGAKTTERWQLVKDRVAFSFQNPRQILFHVARNTGKEQPVVSSRIGRACECDYSSPPLLCSASASVFLTSPQAFNAMYEVLITWICTWTEGFL